MFKRLWNVISVGVSVWSIQKTLKTLSENKNEMFTEFYSTLSPQEKKTWVKVFGYPPIAEVQPFELPIIKMKETPKVTQVEKLEASV